MKNLLKALAVLAACGVAAPSLADCPLTTTVRDVTDAYAKAQSFEKSGKHREALSAYVRAQAETCDPNPVAANAARRAAALAPALAEAALARGDHQSAFDLFEAGGYFARADRELVEILRANPDDPSLYERARMHFEARTLPAFQANNREQIAAAGAYQADPALIAAVRAALRKGADRALQREAQAFNEAYLAELVQLVQTRPDNILDFDAAREIGARQRAFAAKWPKDQIEESLRALDLFQRWAGAAMDPAERAALDAARNQRIDARVKTLTQRFSGAPQLLDAAIKYARRLTDHEMAEARVAKVQSQALRLGDAAAKSNRRALAIEYYDVADAKDKAAALQQQLRNEMHARYAPQVEQMQRDAAAIQRELNDPARVQEMRRQAEAAARGLSPKFDATQRRKETDQMADELGL